MPLVQTLARATRQPRRVKPNAAAAVDASAIANALTLIGNDGANRLLGTAHADTLISNKGNDSLTGGGGADSFAFNQSPGASNRDTLTDFTVGADKLTFSRAVDKTLGAGNTTAQLLLDSGGSPIQTASSRCCSTPAPRYSSIAPTAVAAVPRLGRWLSSRE